MTPDSCNTLQHGPWTAHSPIASTWLHGATMTTVICMTLATDISILDQVVQSREQTVSHLWIHRVGMIPQLCLGLSQLLKKLQIAVIQAADLTWQVRVPVTNSALSHRLSPLPHTCQPCYFWSSASLHSECNTLSFSLSHLLITYLFIVDPIWLSGFCHIHQARLSIVNLAVPFCS